jgi:hypothetical protein
VCQVNGEGATDPKYFFVVFDTDGPTQGVPHDPVRRLRFYHNNDFSPYTKTWPALLHYKPARGKGGSWRNAFAKFDPSAPPVTQMYAELDNWSNLVNTEAFVFGVQKPDVTIERPDRASPPLPVDATIKEDSSYRFKAKGLDSLNICYRWIAENRRTLQRKIIGTEREFEKSFLWPDEAPGQYNIILEAYPCDFPDCSTMSARTLDVTPRRGVYLPSAFSPNNDGTGPSAQNNNDEFCAWFFDVESIQFQIFNRWGLLICEIPAGTAPNTLPNPKYLANGPPNRPDLARVLWNGSNNCTGTQVPEGVYVYKINVVYNGGAIDSRAGSITLIR